MAVLRAIHVWKDTDLYTQKALKKLELPRCRLRWKRYMLGFGVQLVLGSKTLHQIDIMDLVYGFSGVKAYYGLVTAADIILAGTVTLMMTGLTDSVQNYSKALLNTSYIKVLDEFPNLESRKVPGNPSR